MKLNRTVAAVVVAATIVGGAAACKPEPAGYGDERPVTQSPTKTHSVYPHPWISHNAVPKPVKTHKVVLKKH